MPLPSCECVAGLPPQQQLANIYCALYTLAQGGGGGGVTYPLSPALGGTGVANAAAETITINGGAGIILNQSLQTTDEPVFANLSTGTLTCNELDVVNVISTGDVSALTFNGLTITNNGGNTLNIAAGSSLTTTGGSVFLNGPGSLTFGTSNTYTLNNSDNQDSTLNFGNSAAPGTTAPIGTPANVYGNPAVALLAEPDAWMTVIKGITSYRVPLYNA